MMTLRDAMAAVDARKTAVLGDEEPTEQTFYGDGSVRLQYAADEDQDKAVLSGYDLDYDELMEVLDEMATFFCNVSHQVGLHLTFKAALAEALQLGLVKGADSRVS